MKGREEYTWPDLRQDLALYSPLTWNQTRDLLAALERGAEGGDTAVTPPYDLLQPLTILCDPEATYAAKGIALHRLVLRLPDTRGGN